MDREKTRLQLSLGGKPACAKSKSGNTQSVIGSRAGKARAKRTILSLSAQAATVATHDCVVGEEARAHPLGAVVDQNGLDCEVPDGESHHPLLALARVRQSSLRTDGRSDWGSASAPNTGLTGCAIN